MASYNLTLTYFRVLAEVLHVFGAILTDGSQFCAMINKVRSFNCIVVRALHLVPPHGVL